MKETNENIRLRWQLWRLFLAMISFYAVWQLHAEIPLIPSDSNLPAYEASPLMTVDPKDLHGGGRLEDITIYAKESADSDKKIARKGQVALYPSAKANIVICHGFMCDKHDVAFLRRLFPHGHYNVYSFDFRGHGEDKGGVSCTFGRDEIYDVQAAVEYVKSQNNLPCIAYGFSMGAASAIEAQARNHSLFDAMILDCPFDSSENVIKQGLEGMKISAFGYDFKMPGCSLLQKYAFHPHVQAFVKNVLRCITTLDPRNIQINMCRVYPAESIKKVSVPCLFIHCKNDERINVQAARNIYNNSASKYKILRITNGRSHFDSYFYAPEKYTSWVREFLQAVTENNACCQQLQQVVEE
jgi:esterase/lipase